MFRNLLKSGSELKLRAPWEPLEMRQFSRKKPRWLPTAPSKVFRIPQRPNIPAEEKRRILTLFNHYRTEMKSLRGYFVEKAKESSTGEEFLAERAKEEEEAHLAAVRVNEEWNRRVGQEREAVLLREKEEEMERILFEVEEAKRAHAESKQKMEELVKQEKERAKTFITPENIDEAIEHALNNPVDYNFAIDLGGNVYKGRRAKPEHKSEDVLRAATS